ncbi:DUF4160 domain-containing protein [Rhizobium wuzhouense]|uniref:DUF4160 domain-containing protein n=1 Tax=Rhizobium wuzhouense TaxID=1986026 RepID=A0ABX5NPW8_9HYPH|nr:DUF4160 domain-containing protein [Rhizobium wuzhouense]PYB72578.1 DUF4160 domain-containing protein [Rhizobium wuzhouense]
MPTIFEWKGWKFLFFSLDRAGPPHIHVRKDRKELKLWLDPVRVAYNRRVADHEVNAIIDVVNEHRKEFIDAWKRYFG